MSAALHLVVPREEMQPGGPGVFQGHSRGLSRTTLLDREAGSVHVGYAICELAAGGAIDRCLHAFEKTIYVTSGELQLERDGALFRLAPDDYALVSTGTPHAFANGSDEPVRWIEVATPQPKPVGGWQDTFFVETLDPERLPEAPPPGDPRRKLVGRFDGYMPSGAYMHGDLQGFAIKYFVDRDFGAIHLNMFTVAFADGGAVQPSRSSLRGGLSDPRRRRRHCFRRTVLHAERGRLRLDRGRLATCLLSRRRPTGALARNPGTAATNPGRHALARALGGTRAADGVVKRPSCAHTSKLYSVKSFLGIANHLEARIATGCSDLARFPIPSVIPGPTI